VVAALADGFVRAGHDVTLFATGDSQTTARLRYVVKEPPARPGRATAAEVEHALACFNVAHEFDVVNNHLGPLGAALGTSVRTTPVVHTVSDPIDNTSRLWRRVDNFNPKLALIAVSNWQRELAPDLPWLAVCHNGLDLRRYTFRPDPGDYLAFVGRMSPDKGCHRAIAAAREVGLPLRIGAKLQAEHEREYFERYVEPALGDDVVFLGELTYEEKVELLGGALATLSPIDADEAFGLVAAESMACGTPVVTMRRGAAPEVVKDGITGFVVDDEDDLAPAIRRVPELDRVWARRRVEECFSAERMTAAYEEAFRISVTPSRTVRRTATTRVSDETRSLNSRSARVSSSSSDSSATRPLQRVLSAAIRPRSDKRGRTAS
jgi:glycosyltransferase involved in cell wall biosynthesis